MERVFYGVLGFDERTDIMGFARPAHWIAPLPIRGELVLQAAWPEERLHGVAFRLDAQTTTLRQMTIVGSPA
ncbi:MAG: hypothetical protein GYB64_14445 [Chloroflexi bacterium]|nr:hypothetical protein [Chloroflexota bacterium]